MQDNINIRKTNVTELVCTLYNKQPSIVTYGVTDKAKHQSDLDVIKILEANIDTI